MEMPLNQKPRHQVWIMNINIDQLNDLAEKVANSFDANDIRLFGSLVACALNNTAPVTMSELFPVIDHSAKNVGEAIGFEENEFDKVMHRTFHLCDKAEHLSNIIEHIKSDKRAVECAIVLVAMGIRAHNSCKSFSDSLVSFMMPPPFGI